MFQKPNYTLHDILLLAMDQQQDGSIEMAAHQNIKPINIKQVITDKNMVGILPQHEIMEL